MLHDGGGLFHGLYDSEGGTLDAAAAPAGPNP
jgi:hypothetical protein